MEGLGECASCREESEERVHAHTRMHARVRAREPPEPTGLDVLQPGR